MFSWNCKYFLEIASIFFLCKEKRDYACIFLKLQREFFLQRKYFLFWISNWEKRESLNNFLFIESFFLLRAWNEKSNSEFIENFMLNDIFKTISLLKEKVQLFSYYNFYNLLWFQLFLSTFIFIFSSCTWFLKRFRNNFRGWGLKRRKRLGYIKFLFFWII